MCTKTLLLCTSRIVTVWLLVAGCCPMLPAPKKTSKLDSAIYFQSKSEQAICQSIAAKDMSSLKRLIQEVPDVNVQGKSGMTFLFWAWIEDNLPAYKALLAAGASPDIKLDETITTGIQVFAKGDSVLFATFSAQRGEAFFNTGLAHTKDPNQVDLGGNGLLHRLYATGSSSARFKSLPQIIATGIDLDQVDSTGHSALEAAVSSTSYSGDLGCITLLEAGANPICNGRKLYDEVCFHVHSSNAPDPRLVAIKKWLEDHKKN